MIIAGFLVWTFVVFVTGYAFGVWVICGQVSRTLARRVDQGLMTRCEADGFLETFMNEKVTIFPDKDREFFGGH